MGNETKTESEFTYNEKQVKFLNGAFLGALLKTGVVELRGTLEDIEKVGKEYWDRYRDLSSLPDQQDVPK